MDDTRGLLEQVIAKIAWHADHDEGRGACDYFTKDAVLEVKNTGFTTCGRREIDALHRIFEGEQYASRHVYTNLVIHDQKSDSIRASNVVTAYLYKGPGPHSADPTLIADLTYDFVCEADGQWRIAKRVAEFVFGGADHLHEK